MARLTAAFWVAAYRARLEAEGIPAHILHRGDETAGAVAVKLATMDGRASLFTRHYDAAGERVWTALVADGCEAEVDAVVARERRIDPDLWVVEIEDPRGRHLLDRPGLEG
jgi:hypothetical protein